MRSPLTSRSKINNKKLRSIKLATEDAKRLRRPRLHDNAPKKVTTQQAPPLPRPHRSRVFTWSLMWRG
jgi:hypothetical protein